MADQGNSQNIISSDGKYVATVIDKSLNQKNPILVLQSTVDGSRKEIPNGKGAALSPQEKYFLYQVADTLCVLSLNTDKQMAIPRVAEWKSAKNGGEEWIAYQDVTDKKLVLYNLDSKKQLTFTAVKKFFFVNHGRVLIQTQANELSSLHWVNLHKLNQSLIWSGTAEVSDYCFDEEGLGFAFMATDKKKDRSNSIWYFQDNMTEAVVLVSNEAFENNNLVVSSEKLVKSSTGKGAMQFSPNGSKLLFYLKEKKVPKINRPSFYVETQTKDFYDLENPSIQQKILQEGKVDVWSYLDPKLMLYQMEDLRVARQYATIIDIPSRKVIQLENKKTELVVTSSSDLLQFNDQYCLLYEFSNDILDFAQEDFSSRSTISNNGTSLYEFDWNKTLTTDVCLVSLNDGSRRSLEKNIKPLSKSFPMFMFSPAGKYVFSFDVKSGSYCSYDISKNAKKNISLGSNTSFFSGDVSYSSFYFSPRTNYRWFQNDAGVLVFDQHSDLWQLDLSGETRPLCLTNGYSREQPIWFRLLTQERKLLSSDKKQEILLAAFFDDNRIAYPGIYSAKTGTELDPAQLIKAGREYLYSGIVKATRQKMYVLERKNSNTPGNSFYTKDFQKLIPITSAQPELRKVVKKELLTWTTFDGRKAHGILIKPKDFDNTKKYPVLINYYDSSRPSLAYGSVTFYQTNGSVSQDFGPEYLHFIPDIKFKTGNTGEDAFNYVVSGAEFLAKLPYIDKKRMGIYGSSFGGYETNYIVTHTNLFAAAYSGCGNVNLIGYFGTLTTDKRRPSQRTQRDQLNIGTTPWERPDLYIRNSPIFYADKVQTPLLLAYNPNDFNTPFDQGVEFFVVLRRLGKRAWMLVAETGHLTARQPYFQQFFDHYLLGRPAPKWMLEGVPAQEQGLSKWLELDNSGKTPPTGGILWEQETVTPDQVPLLKNKTRVTNEGRIVDVVEGVKEK